MPSRFDRWFWGSVGLAVVAFAADRIQKGLTVDPACMAWGRALCPSGVLQGPGSGWHGGEAFQVTEFFTYVLVWNPGISYGLLTTLPVWILGLVMVLAIIGLLTWWWRTPSALVRCGLAVAIGGALSNALDRGLYGAVADFFYFHWQHYSFYVFNIADSAITIGVVLLFADFLRDALRKKH